MRKRRTKRVSMTKIDDDETRNINGNISDRVHVSEYTYNEVMDLYDSLPKHVRDVVKNTTIPVLPGKHVNVNTKFGFQIFMAALQEAELESTILTYGDDYPYEIKRIEQ